MCVIVSTATASITTTTTAANIREINHFRKLIFDKYVVVVVVGVSGVPMRSESTTRCTAPLNHRVLSTEEGALRRNLNYFINN